MGLDMCVFRVAAYEARMLWEWLWWFVVRTVESEQSLGKTCLCVDRCLRKLRRMYVFVGKQVY